MFNWLVSLFHIHDWEPWSKPYINTAYGVNLKQAPPNNKYEIQTTLQARCCKTCGKYVAKEITYKGLF